MILSSDNACDSLDWFTAAGSLINNLSLPLSSLVGYATHFYGKQIILWCDVEGFLLCGDHPSSYSFAAFMFEFEMPRGANLLAVLLLSVRLTVLIGFGSVAAAAAVAI